MKLWIFLLVLGAPVALAPSAAHATPQKKVTLKWPTFQQVANRKSVSDVVAIQYLLRSRGFYKSAPDGVFGAQTAASVRAFQRKNGLKVDGIVAAQTFSRLIKTLKRGDRGDVVRALQILMHQMGDGNGDPPFKYHAVDGIFGKETDEVLRLIQNWIGYRDGRETRSLYPKSDGIAGPQTWCSLFGGNIE